MKVSISLILAAILSVIFASCNGCAKNKRPSTNAGDTYKGEVIKILDGDTYDLLTEEKETVRIRMSGIDAPEKGQPFYRKSKDYLGDLCFRKIITAKQITIDQWGRIVAESYTADGVNLSNEMLKNGFAWHFKRYNQDAILAQLETDARQKGLGIWSEPNAIPPWEIRARRRSGKKDTDE